jgi:hypothetical protein
MKTGLPRYVVTRIEADRIAEICRYTDRWKLNCQEISLHRLKRTELPRDVTTQIEVDRIAEICRYTDRWKLNCQEMSLHRLKRTELPRYVTTQSDADLKIRRFKYCHCYKFTTWTDLNGFAFDFLRQAGSLLNFLINVTVETSNTHSYNGLQVFRLTNFS